MLRFLFSLLVVVSAFAQSPVQQIQFQAAAPEPVQFGSVSLTGASGSSQYCYFVVAHYTIGSATVSPAFCAFNAPNALSVSNGLRVSWTPPLAASSFDVLRLTGPIFPASGSCSCAVASGTSGTTFTDQGSSATSYTLTVAAAASANLILNNRDYGSPQLVVKLPGQDPFTLALSGNLLPFTAPTITTNGGSTGSHWFLEGLFSATSACPSNYSGIYADSTAQSMMEVDHCLVQGPVPGIANAATAAAGQVPVMSTSPGGQAKNLTASPLAVDSHGRPSCNASPLVTGDFAISAGWGAGATVTVIGGTDCGFAVQVTTPASGTFTGGPNITLTYHDGAFPFPQLWVCNPGGGTGTLTFWEAPYPTYSTTTAQTIFYEGTAAASKTYLVNCVRGL